MPRLTEMSTFFCFVLQCTVVLRIPGYAALQGLCAHVEAESCRHCPGCVWRRRSDLYYRPNSGRKRAPSLHCLFFCLTTLLQQLMSQPAAVPSPVGNCRVPGY